MSRSMGSNCSDGMWPDPSARNSQSSVRTRSIRVTRKISIRSRAQRADKSISAGAFRLTRRYHAPRMPPGKPSPPSGPAAGSGAGWPPDPAVFEKLGVFYLGRVLDPATQQPQPLPLLYDARDLATHAVIVGMTGSGKTGLGISLLEEAAIDGIPAIAIDPKGDLGNLMLAFPELRPV